MLHAAVLHVLYASDLAAAPTPSTSHYSEPPRMRACLCVLQCVQARVRFCALLCVMPMRVRAQTQVRIRRQRARACASVCVQRTSHRRTHGRLLQQDRNERPAEEFVEERREQNVHGPAVTRRTALPGRPSPRPRLSRRALSSWLHAQTYRFRVFFRLANEKTDPRRPFRGVFGGAFEPSRSAKPELMRSREPTGGTRLPKHKRTPA